MNTGKLDKRVVISIAGTPVKTAMGGFTEGTPTTKTVWCNVRQLSMYESLNYGLETTNASFSFTFLYYASDDISKTTKLTYKGKTFRVISIQDINEEKKTITVIANERV